MAFFDRFYDSQLAEYSWTAESVPNMNTDLMDESDDFDSSQLLAANLDVSNGYLSPISLCDANLLTSCPNSKTWLNLIPEPYQDHHVFLATSQSPGLLLSYPSDASSSSSFDCATNSRFLQPSSSPLAASCSSLPSSFSSVALSSSPERTTSSASFNRSRLSNMSTTDSPGKLLPEDGSFDSSFDNSFDSSILNEKYTGPLDREQCSSLTPTFQHPFDSLSPDNWSVADTVPETNETGAGNGAEESEINNFLVPEAHDPFQDRHYPHNCYTQATQPATIGSYEPPLPNSPRSGSPNWEQSLQQAQTTENAFGSFFLHPEPAAQPELIGVEGLNSFGPHDDGLPTAVFGDQQNQVAPFWPTYHQPTGAESTDFFGPDPARRPSAFSTSFPPPSGLLSRQFCQQQQQQQQPFAHPADGTIEPMLYAPPPPPPHPHSFSFPQARTPFDSAAAAAAAYPQLYPQSYPPGPASYSQMAPPPPFGAPVAAAGQLGPDPISPATSNSTAPGSGQLQHSGTPTNSPPVAPATANNGSGASTVPVPGTFRTLVPPPPMTEENANCPEMQDLRNKFLVDGRQQGMSYKEIREAGGFTEAESTLRGRYRILTKNREDRVRKPVWHDCDVLLLRRAVKSVTKAPSHEACSSVDPNKVPWKKVTEYIKTNGGSYQFGFATCKKKWLQLRHRHPHPTN